jgi:hypothetical protein
MTLPLILALGLAVQAAAPPPAVADQQVLALTMEEDEMGYMLDTEFLPSAESQDFFRRAGPFEGCDTYEQLHDETVARYYPRFRVELIAAFREAVPAAVLRRAAADGAVSMYGSPALERYAVPAIAARNRRTRALVAAAAVDLKAATVAWLAAAPSSGPPRGIDRAGVPFWRANPHSIGGFCRLPAGMRPGILMTWLQGVSQ